MRVIHSTITTVAIAAIVGACAERAEPTPIDDAVAGIRIGDAHRDVLASARERSWAIDSATAKSESLLIFTRADEPGVLGVVLHGGRVTAVERIWRFRSDDCASAERMKDSLARVLDARFTGTDTPSARSWTVATEPDSVMAFVGVTEDADGCQVGVMMMRAGSLSKSPNP
jgi:hypothetical protein